MSRIAYVNGRFCPIEDASISILDRGFIFADGIYEVTAVLDGKLVDYPGHIARLHRSLGEIQLSCPVKDDELLELHKDLARQNGLTEGGIYLQVTRGAADRDFKFPGGDVKPSLVMFTQARSIRHSKDAETGIAVKTVPDIRWQRRDIKSIALLAQVLAKQEAAAAGCAEAWMMDQDGNITEGGSSSAFIVTQDGTLIARPLSNEILPGITRIAMLKLAEELQVNIEYRTFTLREALQAREAFNTSASGFVMPVVKIDSQTVSDGKPGALSRRLRTLYIDEALSSGIEI